MKVHAIEYHNSFKKKSNTLMINIELWFLWFQHHQLSEHIALNSLYRISHKESRQFNLVDDWFVWFQLNRRLFLSFISIKSIECIDIHLKSSTNGAHVNRDIEFAINALNSIHFIQFIYDSPIVYDQSRKLIRRNNLGSRLCK